MKKLFTLLFATAFLFSCSSDSSSDSNTVGLSNTPLAKAEFDSSNFGIYKGVIIGSSGVITINIKNDGNINATLLIDGVSTTYSSVEEVTLNQPITNLTFTSNNNTFDVNVSASGDDISVVSSNITGHLDATFNVVKEYATDLVKCYQGTYTGASDNGVFNIIILDQDLYGLSQSNAFPETDTLFLNGGYIDNVISGTFSGGTFVGTTSGNTISGSWQNTSQESGTWTGQRTL
jgi:hypothetical protein